MVLLNFLLPIFFVAFSFSELFRIQLPNSIAFSGIDIVLPLVILFWALFVKKDDYKLKKPIFIFFAVGLFSLAINFTKFTNEQIAISSLYLFRWILYSSIYFVFADIGKSHEKKIQRYMNIAGIIILVAGFIQYFLYPSLKNLYYLGWDEHMFRLFSTFLDPNFAGIILVLFFVFIFVLRDKLFKNKSIAILVSAFTFIAIILTYSRGALLMLVVCALTYSIIKKNYKIILGTIVLLAVIFIVLSPKFYIENTNLLRTVSTTERIRTSVEALKIFQKNPLGVGFNTYRYAREKYGDRDLSRFGPSHSGAGVDNSLVLVLVTTGIPGIVVYLYLLYELFKLGLSNIKKNKYAVILIVSLAGLVINSFTINSLFYSFVMIWIWALAGLTESSSRG